MMPPASTTTLCIVFGLFLACIAQEKIHLNTELGFPLESLVQISSIRRSSVFGWISVLGSRSRV